MPTDDNAAAAVPEPDGNATAAVPVPKPKLTKEEKKALKWAHSDAKAQLYEDLVDGVIPMLPDYKAGDLKPKQLFDSHYKHLAPFKISDFHKSKMFTTRLGSLRKQVRE